MDSKREKVRILISKYLLTYTWLINELEKRDVIVTNNELSDFLIARRRGEKADRVIDCCLKILEDYGKAYGDK